MSQQELLPEEPQGQYGASSEDEEIYQPPQPYTWSGKVGQEAMPRDEPPSSYDPTIMQDYQAGYRAQDEAPAVDLQPPYQYNPYMPDGDAQEQGYRPYNTYTYNNASNQNYQNNGQVPPWARPQERRYGPWRFGSILMILIFISILQGVFSHGGFVFGHIFGVFLGVIWPIFILLFFFSMFARRAVWGGRRRRGPWWYGRRGPWWW